MNEFEGHPGTSRLATVLSRRIKKENESPHLLDFGEIQENGSLVTNTFPVAIPRGEYTVCRTAGGLTFSIEGQNAVKLPSVKAGDRVLVAWVQNEAVVIDVISEA